MKIKDILSRESVKEDLQATNKQEAIRELSQMIQQAHPDISSEQLFSILMERENLGSTGIGNSVAIPHGKLSSLSNIVTGFARSVKGLEFDSQDGKPVHLFFVLIAPENAASLHLKALARLSRLLKDVNFRNKLMEAKDGDQIYKEIVTEDEKF
ncbi:MAG: PTS sugar transporter subunit IIA [Deltaproteobacteria bacterium]|nr:MAG: PTS sugar transporter subunit IIA [Deltaproteobacteria bacterium]